ncbi:YraN family protein [Chitinophaga horti]|uniref:UPF0102 protein MKQ68_08310 n=1 Tax=Chitinophaga horti TaxID=2920382 RepID=A0ABY6J657_9BACT|nr:YraN family protein [Chitinophaga horti]UYQ95097.1 YraN family protein [Chitinophaga horti]
MASHHELGKKGEALAAAFLRGKGHRVLHTNWRWGKKEIDIISEHERLIIFTEVKTRSSSLFGWPEEAVDVHKSDLLQRAASRYLEQYDHEPLDIRFDIIAITFSSEENYELLHLVDAIS